MKPIVLILCLLASGIVTGLAQKATLSASTNAPVAGEPFQLQIQVDARAASPGLLDIPGLDVLSPNPSTSTSMSLINGRFSANTTFTYTVLAQKEGPLEIPGISLTVDGKQTTTNPLKLTIAKGNGKPQPRLSPGIPTPPNIGPTPRNAKPPTKIDEETVFVKVLPERDEIYVGETVEVEIKAYLHAGITVTGFDRELNLTGEDFILQPTVGPDVQVRRQGRQRVYHFNQETIDGQPFNVITYRTTLTAVKPGEFALEPVNFNAMIRLPQPQRQRRRARSPLDQLFGDPFDDPFFDSVLNNRSRELRLRSEATKLTVLPLPTEGRPAHFSGAVGRFSLDVSTDKEALEVDDALTVTGTLTGHGNFDRISGLETVEDPTWRAYPPKIAFNSTDELKLSGEKTFEYTFIAQDATDTAPSVQFCFFDPELKAYVNLGGEVIPVSVTGSPSTGLSHQDIASLAAQASEGQVSGMIAAIAPSEALTFFQGERPSLLSSGALLTANGIAALLGIGLLGWQWQRRERSPSLSKRRRQLIDEQRTLAHQLPTTTDPDQFQTQLLRWLAIRQHLQSPQLAIIPDEDAATRAVRALDDGSETRQALDAFLSWAAARRWSRDQAADGSFDTQRQRWCQAFEALRHDQNA